ncbi:hypothetical protein QUA13_15510 [Microcoleus sp. S28C3]|uniref:hypothetical protein n=1 Tax=Microcoleus sp. S28C3 TaxID=3055414 RepID=UPI002FD2872D
MNKIEAAQEFGISCNTIDLWRRSAKRNTRLPSCSIDPLVMVTCITKRAKFREFVKLHKHNTQADIAQLWEAGHDCFVLRPKK